MSVKIGPYSLESEFRDDTDFDDLQDRLGLHPLCCWQLHFDPNNQETRLAAVYADDGTLISVAFGESGGAVSASFGDDITLFRDFLSVNDQNAVNIIRDDLRKWSQNRGAKEMLGPMSVDLSALRGVRMGTHTHTTALGLPDNPAYFSDLLEGCGFLPAQDLYSFRVEINPNARIAKLANYVRKRHPGITIRNFDTTAIESEIAHVVRIYNDAWSDHWGFIPLTETVLLQAFEAMQPLFKEELAFFVMIDGVEQGVSIGIPNPSPLDPENPVKSVRGMLFGVAREFQ